MKCMNEMCGNGLTGRQTTYCSDKCRMAQTRTEGEPKQALKATVEQSMTAGAYNVHTITLAQDTALLAAWAEGKGTAYQQGLGILSQQYDMIRA